MNDSKEAKRSDIGTSESKPPDDPRDVKKDEHGNVIEEPDTKGLLEEKQKAVLDEKQKSQGMS